MGWGSGSEVLEATAKIAKRQFKGDPQARRRFYRAFVKVLRGMDCDTVHEARGIDPELDAVLPKRRR